MRPIDSTTYFNQSLQIVSRVMFAFTLLRAKGYKYYPLLDFHYPGMRAGSYGSFDKQGGKNAQPARRPPPWYQERCDGYHFQR